MLGPFAYIAGFASVVIIATVVAWGAWSFRRALLPGWSGASARLAEVVIFVALPVALSQLLGSFGAFRWGPVFAACVVGGLAIGAIGRRIAKDHPNLVATPFETIRRPTDSERGRAWALEIVAATVATALVGAQWGSHVAAALSRGMTHADTLWYHGPYAARFALT